MSAEKSAVSKMNPGSRPMSMIQAIHSAHDVMLGRDPTVVVLGEPRLYARAGFSRERAARMAPKAEVANASREHNRSPKSAINVVKSNAGKIAPNCQGEDRFKIGNRGTEIPVR